MATTPADAWALIQDLARELEGRGGVPPAMQRRLQALAPKPRGRPPKPTSWWPEAPKQRLAALLVEAYAQAGWGRSRAAEYVCEELALDPATVLKYAKAWRPYAEQALAAAEAGAADLLHHDAELPDIAAAHELVKVRKLPENGPD